MGEPIELTGNGPSLRYVWLRLTLDDTGAEDPSTPTTIDDVTVIHGLPPTPGFVNDGPGEDIDEQTSRSTLEANWYGFGDEWSPIAAYEWAIGTTPGATDVQGWTDVGLATAASNSTLNLHIGNFYYVSVRATSQVGFTSAATVSDGVVPVLPPPSEGGPEGGTGSGKGSCGSIGLDLLGALALLGFARRLRRS
ncbi:MAG: hypothetical protein HY716_15390 [Planctomycetes bacterium]|nr:hypothetical protein [Planctomycetota bacterium]